MPNLMLNPSWPNTFRRTVQVGKKTKRLEFKKNEPVQVTKSELEQMEPDIGNAVFEIEFDDKGRPRFLEPAMTDDHAGQMELHPNENAQDF